MERRLCSIDQCLVLDYRTPHFWPQTTPAPARACPPPPVSAACRAWRKPSFPPRHQRARRWRGRRCCRERRARALLAPPRPPLPHHAAPRGRRGSRRAPAVCAAAGEPGALGDQVGGSQQGRARGHGASATATPARPPATRMAAPKDCSVWFLPCSPPPALRSRAPSLCAAPPPRAPPAHSSSKREGAEAMALLHALISALCGADDSAPPAAEQGGGGGGGGGAAGTDAGTPSVASGALREVAGRLLGEWLDWSARHAARRGGRGGGDGSSGGHEGATRNFNAASLLRRLFDRLAHPSAEARLGAACGMAHCAR
jgi:hypothetical protein